MNDLITQIFSGLAVIALGALGAILWKVSTKIDPILEFMKETKIRDDEQDGRLEAIDTMWTLSLKKNFDSKLIALGDMDIPEPYKRRDS